MVTFPEHYIGMNCLVDFKRGGVYNRIRLVTSLNEVFDVDNSLLRCIRALVTKKIALNIIGHDRRHLRCIRFTLVTIKHDLYIYIFFYLMNAIDLKTQCLVIVIYW